MKPCGWQFSYLHSPVAVIMHISLDLLCVTMLLFTVVWVLMQGNTLSGASRLVFGCLPGGMPSMLLEVIVYL
jgi:hypothetical protein